MWPTIYIRTSPVYLGVQGTAHCKYDKARNHLSSVIKLSERCIGSKEAPQIYASFMTKRRAFRHHPPASVCVPKPSRIVVVIFPSRLSLCFLLVLFLAIVVSLPVVLLVFLLIIVVVLFLLSIVCICLRFIRV